MGLLGAAGSSLSLLFYSTWLREKIGTMHGEAYFSWNFRNVRISQGIAFLLTGIFSFAFMTIGLSSSSSIDFFNGIYLSLRKLPYGVPVFVLTSYVIFIALILTGIDGRARAIASIVRGTGISFRDEKNSLQEDNFRACNSSCFYNHLRRTRQYPHMGFCTRINNVCIHRFYGSLS
ncbi:hypothetical protein [Methanosarcina horonobensis]|uniref:hypothetical protein n=1 Tax=Methanosarcina horonobensis TaxID=418008 RepID=UPI000A3F21CB|nr:hypothetical protein [Methanosarcina horonobensis]